jgi:hypothetical protein
MNCSLKRKSWYSVTSVVEKDFLVCSALSPKLLGVYGIFGYGVSIMKHENPQHCMYCMRFLSGRSGYQVR